MTFRQLYHKLKEADVDLDSEVCIYDNEWNEYNPIDYFDYKILQPNDRVIDIPNCAGTRIIHLF